MSKKNKKRTKKSENIVAKEILRIDWKDHFSGNHQWEDPEDMDHTPKHCVTVGIKVYEDDKVVTLAQNMAQSMRAADTTTVLKECIMETVKLGTVRFQVNP